MKRAEQEKIKKWAMSLTNEELETEYYNAVFDSLDSKTEEMYERGYDMADILEQEKYEKDLIKKSNIIEKICIERNIPLWEEIINEVQNEV